MSPDDRRSLTVRVELLASFFELFKITANSLYVDTGFYVLVIRLRRFHRDKVFEFADAENNTKIGTRSVLIKLDT